MDSVLVQKMQSLGFAHLGIGLRKVRSGYSQRPGLRVCVPRLFFHAGGLSLLRSPAVAGNEAAPAGVGAGRIRSWRLATTGVSHLRLL